MKKYLAALSTIAATWAGEAAAQRPVDGHISMVEACAPIAAEVHAFHYGVLIPIIIFISAFVLGLLLWVIVRYNSKLNPTPRKFSHNTFVEVLWTGIPILILLAIALPSFELLYSEDVIPDGKQTVAQADGATTDFVFQNNFQEERRRVTRAEQLHVFLASANAAPVEQSCAHNRPGKLLQAGSDYQVEGLGKPEIHVKFSTPPAAGESVVMRGGRSLVGKGKLFGVFGEDEREVVLAPTVTVKAIGFQWGWIYSYPDYGDFEFTSNILPADKTTPDLYHWEVDNHMVVPVGETIRVTTTSRDVIHSWAMPNFAIKIDAVPGRINETWFKAEKEGTYYGQCSELCGERHAFMPIAVDVVSRPEFEAWVDKQRALAGLAPMFGDKNAKLAARAESAPAGGN
ncbi:MAG TPA: cytochrome c oxidase subunit II transmembrane domain-containing protein [Parvularculaceae bacterium]|nr:cytochrome c oxidase subunit II transmembrane domain-containing protein [Parvularculaceae bacterium]